MYVRIDGKILQFLGMYRSGSKLHIMVPTAQQGTGVKELTLMNSPEDCAYLEGLIVSAVRQGFQFCDLSDAKVN